MKSKADLVRDLLSAWKILAVVVRDMAAGYVTHPNKRKLWALRAAMRALEKERQGLCEWTADSNQEVRAGEPGDGVKTR